MLLRLLSDPGPPSAPAPDDIFRVTGSRVILVVGLATSSDRTRGEMQENDVRLLPRTSVKCVLLPVPTFALCLGLFISALSTFLSGGVSCFY